MREYYKESSLLESLGWDIVYKVVIDNGVITSSKFELCAQHTYMLN